MSLAISVARDQRLFSSNTKLSAQGLFIIGKLLLRKHSKAWYCPGRNNITNVNLNTNKCSPFILPVLSDKQAQQFTRTDELPIYARNAIFDMYARTMRELEVTLNNAL